MDKFLKRYNFSNFSQRNRMNNPVSVMIHNIFTEMPPNPSYSRSYDFSGKFFKILRDKNNINLINSSNKGEEGTFPKLL